MLRKTVGETTADWTVLPWGEKQSAAKLVGMGKTKKARESKTDWSRTMKAARLAIKKNRDGVITGRFHEWLLFEAASYGLP